MRSIGVSNFSVEKLSHLVDWPEVKIKPAVNQVECHPYLNQRRLLDYCSSRGVVMMAYSPVGAGERPDWTGIDAPSVINESVVKEVANRRELLPADVLLGWHLKRHTNTAVVVKSARLDRITRNYEGAVQALEV